MYTLVMGSKRIIYIMGTSSRLQRARSKVNELSFTAFIR